MPKVLVIDDDKDIQRLLARRLRDAGYEVAFASDGIEALTAARRESPDVIVLDIGLPAGDGYTVLQRLHAIAVLSTIPVIVLSASDPETNRQRAIDAGATTFVSKPFDAETILHAISAALRD